MSEIKKGAWSPEEDQKLLAHISQWGTRNWTQIPKDADLLRTGKSCRLRWLNYLRPGLKRGHFTPEEIIIVMQSHELWGNKWSKIASLLPGRTDNEIKNYWHTYIRKSIVSCSERDTSRSQQERPKKLKQQKPKREIIPRQELSCENSSTISMDSSIDFPIIESYSPNDEYTSSSVSNPESISLSDEDQNGWSYHQNIFAEPFSIEDEQLLIGMNNSSTMAFFDENITWASVLDHQLSSPESSYSFMIGQ